MRLSQFIATHSESILAEFEEFARTHTSAGETMDMVSLRDHAESILRTIALDLEQPQDAREQRRKAQGDAPVEEGAGPTAARRHGLDRADSGFTLAEMFSEYRALRASVLRLWTRTRTNLDEGDVQDLIRFNEATDQAVAESVTEYSTEIENSREMFLAILGHDLRSPLGAVLTASSFLVTEGNLTDRNYTLASRIRISGERMLALVSDLVDFTRSHLGRGMPITRTASDLAAIGRDTVEEIGTHQQGRELHFAASGDLRGEWDGKRVGQALANLVGNAVQHGAEDSPIMVTARGADDEVVIAVHNRGTVISRDDQEQIFNPFKTLSSPEKANKDQGSMGLGLYIAQQVAFAHGGRIDVESSEACGTTFKLHLPRSA